MYNKTGTLIGGGEEKKQVKQFMVLERMISDPDTDWKICKIWPCLD